MVMGGLHAKKHVQTIRHTRCSAAYLLIRALENNVGLLLNHRAVSENQWPTVKLLLCAITRKSNEFRKASARIGEKRA